MNGYWWNGQSGVIGNDGSDVIVSQVCRDLTGMLVVLELQVN